MKRRSWTEKQLKDAVKKSFSYRQVLSKLNLREVGGNYEQVKKYIKEYELDISHFKGRGWNAGLRGIGKPRIPIEKILVKNNDFQSFKLKKRLFNAGLKPRYYEECGWAEKTKDGYLPLELDHINGDRHDNRIENLRVLCPNCHSLKPTHRGRIKKNK
ncbi:HNH endonuclease [Candidatus Wolfebacteria bacterium]|nr:HNH endonuclease [Candidatus Wolfebacteria bacterium]